MKPCQQPRCKNGATMGYHCIQHWYTTQGKTPPRLDPATPSAIPGTAPTSIATAQRVAPKMGTVRARILDMIRLKDGLTRDELEQLLGISPNTLNPRLRELEEMGWIEDSRTTRPTRSGSPAIVWRAL